MLVGEGLTAFVLLVRDALYGISVYYTLKKVLGSRYRLERNSDGILEPLDWGSIITLGEVWGGYTPLIL